jgi:mRNA interferase MazF
MPIKHFPRVGQILICDFSPSFKEPEMVKRRPVLVVADVFKGRGRVLTVVGLSTTAPVVMPFHMRLPRAALPQLQGQTDMIYTVGFHRLDAIQLGTRDQRGKREYFKQRLGRERMRDVYACILHGLNLSEIAQLIRKA